MANVLSFLIPFFVMLVVLGTIIYFRNMRRERKVRQAVPTIYDWLPFLEYEDLRTPDDIWRRRFATPEEQLQYPLRYIHVLERDLERLILLEEMVTSSVEIDPHTRRGWYRLTEVGRDWLREMKRKQAQSSTRTPITA